jgi:hypothetical protein
MAWAFTNSHGGGAEAEEGRSPYEVRIGVHRLSGDVFHDVGFKQDRFSTDVQIEEPKSVVDQFVEFVRVLIYMQDRDA